MPLHPSAPACHRQRKRVDSSPVSSIILRSRFDRPVGRKMDAMGTPGGLPMSWDLDAEHRDFQAVCRTFVDWHVRSAVGEAEALGRVPQQLWKKLGAAGLLGLLTPEEYGGSGGDQLAVALLAEELARASGGIAISPLVGAYMAAPHIAVYGSAEQRAAYLPGLARGESVAALAVTEPDAGSDV